MKKTTGITDSLNVLPTNISSLSITNRKSVEKKNNCTHMAVYSAGSKTIASGKSSLASLFCKDTGGLIRTQDLKVLSWHRGDYWHIPVHSTELSSIQPNTQNILFEQKDGTYVLLMGLIGKDNCTTFCMEEELLATFDGTLAETSDQSEATVESATDDQLTQAIACAVGTDPFYMVHQTFAWLSTLLGTFELRENKGRPPFAQYLGWCTWDAFYHTVDAEKVEEGLKTFAQKGIKPRFMILDDGALHTQGDYLEDFRVSDGKFPGGLANFVNKVKDKYGIKMFGLWHAFEGYWAGVDPESDIAKKYGVIHNTGDIRPWIEDEPLYNLYYIDPANVERFFADWYDVLREEKIDFIKVDGQSAMEIFTKDKAGRVGVMTKFQQAMQAQAELHFGPGNMISCMSNGTDVYLNLSRGNAWRNSNDYFPEGDLSVQQKHIYYNIYNAFLSANFAWPDWDMFQSHRKHSQVHAISRALSGGPVYVCDSPGKQDEHILNRLILADGTIPQFDRPALPTADSIMQDTLNGNTPAKISNVKAYGEITIGVVAAFNCSLTCQIEKGTIKAADIPEMQALLSQTAQQKEALGFDDRFAIYNTKTGRTVVQTIEDSVPFTVKQGDVVTFVISPVIHGIAMFGMVDKYAMPATLSKLSFNTETDSETGRARIRCHAKIDAFEKLLLYADNQPRFFSKGAMIYDALTGATEITTRTGEIELGIEA